MKINRNVLTLNFFETVIVKARDFGIRINIPTWVMTAIELGLINTVKRHSGRQNLDCASSIYASLCIDRPIQSEGLQALYNSPQDRSIKTAFHNYYVMHLSLRTSGRRHNTFRDIARKCS